MKKMGSLVVAGALLLSGGFIQSSTVDAATKPAVSTVKATVIKKETFTRLSYSKIKAVLNADYLLSYRSIGDKFVHNDLNSTPLFAVSLSEKRGINLVHISTKAYNALGTVYLDPDHVAEYERDQLNANTVNSELLKVLELTVGKKEAPKLFNDLRALSIKDGLVSSKDAKVVKYGKYGLKLIKTEESFGFITQ